MNRLHLNTLPLQIPRYMLLDLRNRTFRTPFKSQAPVISLPAYCKRSGRNESDKYKFLPSSLGISPSSHLPRPSPRRPQHTYPLPATPPAPVTSKTVFTDCPRSAQQLFPRTLLPTPPLQTPDPRRSVRSQQKRYQMGEMALALVPSSRRWIGAHL